jgi:hypothetical protein
VEDKEHQVELAPLTTTADYVFFNTFHRRVSVQVTTASDLNANRNLDVTPVDERQSLGLARIEFEPFQRLVGKSLTGFIWKGRHEDGFV